MTPPRDPMHPSYWGLAARIEPDAHLLFLRLMTTDKNLIVFTDSREYADGVMNILEGLYPGAAERVQFEVLG
jgi:hypothetical protein